MKASKATKSYALSGMLNSVIGLSALRSDDHERFVKDYQRAFLSALTRTHGRRKHYYSYTDEIIPDTAVESLLRERNSRAYGIMIGDALVGGVLIHTVGVARGKLDLLYVTPCAQGCGIGAEAWMTIKRLHPGIGVWEATAAFFERQNLHFLINCCGFYIVEYYNRRRPNPNASVFSPANAREEVFRLEKSMSDQDL